MDILWLKLMLLCSYACYVSGDNPGVAKMITKIRSDLFTEYDKYTIPGNITVKVGITFISIEAKEESSQIIVHGWLRMTWNDHRLKWNPEDYAGVSLLNTPADHLWRPDLLLYNNLDAERAEHSFQETLILQYNDGKILWVPRSVLYGHCQFDLRLWPYDEQSCFLKFGSWTHDGNKMALELYEGENSSRIDDYLGETEWEVTKAEAEHKVKFYPCCTEGYPHVTFTVYLKRHYDFHASTVMVSAYALVSLVLLSFWLDPSSPERFNLGIANVFLCVLYLQYLGELLPKHGSSAPLIVLFFRDSLVMVVISMILTVVYRRFVDSSTKRALPRNVHSLLSSWLGTVLCLTEVTNTKARHPPQNSLRSIGAELEVADNIIVYDDNNSLRNYDWIILILDRLIFLLYIIVFVVFLCAFCG